MRQVEIFPVISLESLEKPVKIALIVYAPTEELRTTQISGDLRWFHGCSITFQEILKAFKRISGHSWDSNGLLRLSEAEMFQSVSGALHGCSRESQGVS